MFMGELLDRSCVILQQQFLRSGAHIPEKTLRYFQRAYHHSHVGWIVRLRIITSAFDELPAKCLAPILGAHLPAVEVNGGQAFSGRECSQLLQQTTLVIVPVAAEGGGTELVAFKPVSGPRCRAGCLPGAAGHKAHDRPSALGDLPVQCPIRFHPGCQVDHTISVDHFSNVRFGISGRHLNSCWCMLPTGVRPNILQCLNVVMSEAHELSSGSRKSQHGDILMPRVAGSLMLSTHSCKMIGLMRRR